MNDNNDITDNLLSNSVLSNITLCSTNSYHSSSYYDSEDVTESEGEGEDTPESSSDDSITSFTNIDTENINIDDLSNLDDINSKETTSSNSEMCNYSYLSDNHSTDKSIDTISDNDDVDECINQTVTELVNNMVDNNNDNDENDIHNLTYTPDPINNTSLVNVSNILNTPIIINKDERIVASLTCTYEGLQYVKQTLISLHDQEFDCIYLNVPGRYFSNSRDLVPEWMKICCEVIFCQDIGPIIKILPILEREPHPSTIIVTVENGIIYPKNMAKTFIQIFRKNTQSVYAINVYKFKSINYFQPITINNNVGDIFDGVNGVGYLRGFFRNDINTYISIINKYEACVYSDYLIICNYLQKYKINISKKKKFIKLVTGSSMPKQ